eukprot:scaffold50638_cov55-Phaeocystis_antarctica.AAC.2
MSNTQDTKHKGSQPPTSYTTTKNRNGGSSGLPAAIRSGRRASPCSSRHPRARLLLHLRRLLARLQVKGLSLELEQPDAALVCKTGELGFLHRSLAQRRLPIVERGRLRELRCRTSSAFLEERLQDEELSFIRIELSLALWLTAHKDRESGELGFHRRCSVQRRSPIKVRGRLLELRHRARPRLPRVSHSTQHESTHPVG